MTEEMLEEPRWPNGPPICLFTNLLAFESESQMTAFFNSLCGSAMVKWKCCYCSGYHAWSKPKSPSGDSCGTARSYHIPADVIDLIRNSRSHEPDPAA